MRFDPPGMLACCIAAGLAASPLASAPGRYLELSICGMSDEKVQIPIPGKSPPRPDCPPGCHALACRRGEAEEDPL